MSLWHRIGSSECACSVFPQGRHSGGRLEAGSRNNVQGEQIREGGLSGSILSPLPVVGAAKGWSPKGSKGEKEVSSVGNPPGLSGERKEEIIIVFLAAADD